METKKFIDGIETVKKVKWLLSSLTNMEMYMYDDASVEANKEVLRISVLRPLVEPLEKLYKYENQPDMKEKINKDLER